MQDEVRVITPEEAAERERQFEQTRTGNERLAAMLELRNAWLKPHQRRLKRTGRFVEVPPR